MTANSPFFEFLELPYRVFLNENFFKIMDGETDKSLYFIGYTKVKPKWAKD